MEAESQVENIEFVGIDLGHGESAVAVVSGSSKALPKILEYRGRKSVLSVVARHPTLGVLIGEDALSNADASAQLWRRYKNQRLGDENVRTPTRLFVERLISEIRQKKLIDEQLPIQFLVGCPTGWKADVRDRYATLLQQAGLPEVTIVSESRAAFLAARDSGELHIAPELLASVVLIIDMGSSTVDFTAVAELQEQLVDFGDNQLGAGLIDKAILDYLVAHHENAAELRRIFAEVPYYEGTCELLCRKAKEQYFTAEVDYKVDPERKASGGVGAKRIKAGLYFETDLSANDMQAILARPLPELGNQTWPEAFDKRLRQVKKTIQDQLGRTPDLVLLTGGASRMGFALEMCQKIFPTPTVVVRGREPEFSVATGLALAGRVDFNVARFERDVQSLLDTREVHKVVEDEILALIEAIADLIVDVLPGKFIMPEFETWRSGEIKTLKGVTDNVNARLQYWLERGEGQMRVREIISEWYQEISPKIEALTTPICDRYGISTSAFRLDETVVAAGGLLGEDKSPMGRVYDDIAGAIAVIIPVIIAAVLTVATVAVTWGIGLVIAIVGVMLAAVFADAVRGKVLNADIPTPLRKLVLPDQVLTSLQGKKEEIQRDVVDALSQPENKTLLVENLVKPIKLELQRDAERAKLLVR